MVLNIVLPWQHPAHDEKRTHSTRYRLLRKERRAQVSLAALWELYVSMDGRAVACLAVCGHAPWLQASSQQKWNGCSSPDESQMQLAEKISWEGKCASGTGLTRSGPSRGHVLAVPTAGRADCCQCDPLRAGQWSRCQHDENAFVSRRKVESTLQQQVTKFNDCR